MTDKIRAEIESIEMRIEWKKESLDKAVAEFKEAAVSYDSYQIAEFIPGKVAEIQRRRTELEQLANQKQMLEYLLEQK